MQMYTQIFHGLSGNTDLWSTILVCFCLKKTSPGVGNLALQSGCFGHQSWRLRPLRSLHVVEIKVVLRSSDKTPDARDDGFSKVLGMHLDPTSSR